MSKKKSVRLFSWLFGALITLSPIVQAQAFVFEEKITLAKGLAHYMMGHMYDLYGYSDRAALEYQKAASFDETSYLIHLRLGADYARLGLLTEAKQELDLVNKYNPEDLQSHYLLAIIHSSQKDYDSAAKEYEFILRKFTTTEPENVEIYNYLGQLYYSQRKYDQAIEQFERVLSFEPDNPDVMYLLGSLYIEVKNVDRAKELLLKSIELDPMHDGSLNTLGYLYADTKINLDEALNFVDRALEIDPDNGAYLDSLGWVYYNKGMYQKALEIFQQAEAKLTDPVIYDHMGDVYLKLNLIDNAVKYWELSLSLLPDQQEILQKINRVKNNQAHHNPQN